MKLCELYALLSLSLDKLTQREDISFSMYWDISRQNIEEAVKNTLLGCSVFSHKIDIIVDFIESLKEVKFTEIEDRAKEYFKNDDSLIVASILMPLVYLQALSLALNDAIENAYQLMDEEEFHEQMVDELFYFIRDQYALTQYIQKETNRIIVMFMTGQDDNEEVSIRRVENATNIEELLDNEKMLFLYKASTMIADNRTDEGTEMCKKIPLTPLMVKYFEFLHGKDYIFEQGYILSEEAKQQMKG